MRTLADQFPKYAACHRDRRSIATHIVGIPLIAFALGASRASMRGAHPTTD